MKKLQIISNKNTCLSKCSLLIRKIKREIIEYEDKLKCIKITDDITNDIISFKALLSQGNHL